MRAGRWMMDGRVTRLACSFFGLGVQSKDLDGVLKRHGMFPDIFYLSHQFSYLLRRRLLLSTFVVEG